MLGLVHERARRARRNGCHRSRPMSRKFSGVVPSGTSIALYCYIAMTRWTCHLESHGVEAPEAIAYAGLTGERAGHSRDGVGIDSIWKLV